MKFEQSWSVEEVLSKNKLPGVTFNGSAAESYRLYTLGLSVQEIARERHLAYSTIFRHLCVCIKSGKPVRLADLTVTKHVRNTIVSVIRGPRVNSDLRRLTQIKKVCPEIITDNQIQAVTAFLQVCDHLDRFNCEYEDFKNAMIKGNGTEEPDSDGESEKIIKELDSLVDELKLDYNFLVKTEEKPDKCKGLNEESFYDFTEDSQTFLAAVDAMGGKYSSSMCIRFLKGSKSCDRHRSHALFGSGKHKSKKWWKCIGHILQRDGYLDSQIKCAGQLTFIAIYVSTKGERFLRDVIERPESTKILLKPSQEMLRWQERKLQSVPDAALSSMDPTSSNLLQKDNNSKTENLTENESGKQEGMRLYNPPNLLQKDNNTNTENLVETEIEKTDKLSLIKRTEVALEKCEVEGFTENQILKFGEEFVKVTPPLSVEEVLSKNPLIKLSTFAAECYRLYTTGVPVQEIANKKHLAFSIVLSHLCDCIKAGKAVNLADLTVTKYARDKIISVIRSPFINSDMTVLTAIKNRSPEIITYNQIRAVVAFLQVCDHLDQFNCEYEDFKNAMIPNYSVQFNDGLERIRTAGVVETDDNENMNLDADGEDVKTEAIDVGMETINPPVNEPPPKKMRLDSPPGLFD